jgi:hypothetical protein
MVQQWFPWSAAVKNYLVLRFAWLWPNYLGFDFAWLWLKSAKLLASNDSAKRAWHVQNQPHRAFITWQHHSLDPYGGNEKVQQWFP